jgi:Tol biopolymer transport system component
MRRFKGVLCLVMVAAVGAGCGGGGSLQQANGIPGANSTGGGGGAEQTLQFGALTTRISGTIQPPVTSGGAGAVVTGLAGATISSLVVRPNGQNTKIAFARTNGFSNIWVMNPDGSNAHNISNINKNDSNPSWAPDGTKLAFGSTRSGNFDIWVMNADGSNPVNLTNGNGLSFSPAWSPDGTKIAFTLAFNNHQDIYVMNPDGSNRHNLTQGVGSNDNPTWSPDSTKIAFARVSDIWVMNADGSSPVNLTNGGGNDAQPAWSPDGTKIAFENNSSAIWVMNADGSNPVNLTNGGGTFFSPTWSPDGTKIAFHLSSGGQFDIWVMNADGSNPQNLTNGQGQNDTPSWVGPRARTVIGGSGLLGNTAAGFLFGRSGDTVTSIVTFDTPALSRVNARVSAQTAASTNTPDIVFTISADSLTSLMYSNGLTGPTFTIPVTNGVNSALVDFNANTGLVSNVLPYAANRAATPHPTVSSEAGVRVLRGHFTGVWDAQGQNHAPGGASEVRIDSRTGAILAVK